MLKGGFFCLELRMRPVEYIEVNGRASNGVRQVIVVGEECL